ncbi:hypothetical protein KAW64_02040 [bacterium]|nr:hypothetical protein [bacterium]
MLKTAMAVLVLCLITAAIAAANPIAADIYIDFDPPNEVFFVNTTQYVSFDAYVVIGTYTPWLSASSVSFDLELDPGIAVFATDFVSDLPGATVEGVPGSGITVSAEDCLGEFPLILGRITVFPFTSGDPGYLYLHAHPDQGNAWVNCQDPPEEREYCFVQDGGINTSEVLPRDICGVNPVISSDWGAIKAMFRQ